MVCHPVKDGLDGTGGGIGQNENVVNITKPKERKEFKEMGKNGGFQMLHDHFSQDAGKR